MGRRNKVKDALRSVVPGSSSGSSSRRAREVPTSDPNYRQALPATNRQTVFWGTDHEGMQVAPLEYALTQGAAPMTAFDPYARPAGQGAPAVLRPDTTLAVGELNRLAAEQYQAVLRHQRQTNAWWAGIEAARQSMTAEQYTAYEMQDGRLRMSEMQTQSANVLAHNQFLARLNAHDLTPQALQKIEAEIASRMVNAMALYR